MFSLYQLTPRARKDLRQMMDKSQYDYRKDGKLFNMDDVLWLMSEGCYTHVCEIICDHCDGNHTEALELAFEIHNKQLDAYLNIFTPHHSMSMGDVLYHKGLKKFFIVAAYGFDEVEM